MMDKKETRRRSISTPGIKCCAKDCVTNNFKNSERFFFSFPPCDLSSKRSVERCRTWVKKAGNVELLKCLSTKLAGNFYLCCSHFPDWTATDSNTRYIDSGAVPAYFDCPPLSNVEMEAFPVITEIVEEPMPEVITESNQSQEDNGYCKENVSESANDSVPSPVVKVEEESATDADVTSQDNQEPVSESVIPTTLGVTETAPTESGVDNVEAHDKSSRPSRKAKLNAFDKISGHQSTKKDETPPEKKKPRSTLERSFNIKPRRSLKYKVKRFGRSSLGAHEKSINKMLNTETINESDPERSTAKSIIVSKNILSLLGSRVVKPAEKPTPSRVVATTSLLKTNQLGASRIYGNVQCSVVYNNKNYGEPFNVDNTSSVIPFLRSTGTQTTVGSFDQGRDMLKILNSDKKLCVFSGIPSYTALQNITDATLSMMMTNRDMINDIEPTMRDWIILTCTKFMLGISTEALAVMFELAESECDRIVEKTCLFLRKTLSLQECQKFVWVLPNQVLNGIADYSDNAFQSN